MVPDLRSNQARHAPETSQKTSGFRSSLARLLPKPSQEDEEVGSTHRSLEAAESQAPFSPATGLPTCPSASSIASSCSSCSSRSPHSSYSIGGVETSSPPRSQDPAEQAAEQQLGSASLAASWRAVSEPPLQHQQQQPQLPQQHPSRLSELVNEVVAHLEHASVPLDPEGWQQETIKLEQFAEEMQVLIKDVKPSPITARQSSHSARRREVSVLKGDKDLRWAKQQLRNSKKEHAHMVQLLGMGDSPLEQQQLAVLKALEEEIEQEQQRQKHLTAENRLLEISLARLVKEGTEEDGNVRALQQIERMEKELEVWVMKNGSLDKQVQHASEQLEKTCEHVSILKFKQEKVALQLASEDQKQRIADERAQQEKLQCQAQSLRESVAELKEERKRTGKAHERAMKEKGRVNADLQKQLAELEKQMARVEVEGRVLRRQLKQHLPEHSRPRHTPSQAGGVGQSEPQQPFLQLQQQQQQSQPAASPAAAKEGADHCNLRDYCDAGVSPASQTAQDMLDGAEETAQAIKRRNASNCQSLL